MPKKGTPIGPRVTIEWGTRKVKRAGKTVNEKLTSQVVETTAKLLGLKTSKTGGTGATTKNITTKKGKKLILTGGVNRVGTRKMFVSVDGKIWHQMPVPMGLSLAKAFATVKAGKKAWGIKFQGGTTRLVGAKATKDTKSKAKTATVKK